MDSCRTMQQRRAAMQIWSRNQHYRQFACLHYETNPFRMGCRRAGCLVDAYRAAVVMSYSNPRTREAYDNTLERMLTRFAQAVKKPDRSHVARAAGGHHPVLQCAGRETATAVCRARVPEVRPWGRSFVKRVYNSELTDKQLLSLLQCASPDVMWVDTMII